MAESTTWRVFGAVLPTNLATRSSRVTSINCHPVQDAQRTEHIGEETGYRGLTVPGLPRKTYWSLNGGSAFVVLLDTVLFDILYDAVHLRFTSANTHKGI